MDRSSFEAKLRGSWDPELVGVEGNQAGRGAEHGVDHPRVAAPVVDRDRGQARQPDTMPRAGHGA
jgi:hypothetical protein